VLSVVSLIFLEPLANSVPAYSIYSHARHNIWTTMPMCSV
jgi:hypothetical protein